MTPDQQEHLERIKSEFCRLADIKYPQGAEEHGGNLWDKTPLELVNEAIMEALDQLTFLITLRDRLGTSTTVDGTELLWTPFGRRD